VSQAQPPSLDRPPLQRYGLPDYVIGQNPAAGAHFVFNVDGQQYVNLVSLTVRLVASAAVAAREVVVQYRDTDGNVWVQNGINTTVTAGNTADYFFGAFIPEVVATVNGSSLVPLAPILLPPTWNIRVFVANIDVADQLSRIRFILERYYSNPVAPGRAADTFQP
jgi:hypothetical protein